MKVLDDLESISGLPIHVQMPEGGLWDGVVIPEPLLTKALPALIRAVRAAEAFWKAPLDYTESRNLEEALQQLRNLSTDEQE